MNYLWSFLIGGAICAVVQLVLDFTKLTPARIMTSLVVIGTVLGALGLYAPFAEFAASGATVPLTGFGNVLALGVKRAVIERGALGILTGPLAAMSVGVTSAIAFSLVAALFTRSRDK